MKPVLLKEIKAVLEEEIELARRLYAVVLRDSRIGFEASNHYYYTANDLKEKILICADFHHSSIRIEREKPNSLNI